MELKIETDLNGETHLIRYDNNDGSILMTGTLDECKKSLLDIIKSRHRIAHFTYDGSGSVIDHEQNKVMRSKEFCGL